MDIVVKIMERLAVYTSIDGKILTKVFTPINYEYCVLGIPQGRVTLQKVLVTCRKHQMKTEIWTEYGNAMLATKPEIIEKALEIYSEDVIYESHIGV